MISDLDTLFESGGNVSFPPIVEAIAPDGKDPSVDLARGEFSEVQNDLAPLFVQSLVANMRDGVVSIDDQYTIRIWNRGAERLTGKAGQGIVNQTWNPGLIGLCDASRMPISNEHCPVRHAIGKSMQSIRRL
jgi:PAS domain-containing protein